MNQDRLDFSMVASNISVSQDFMAFTLYPKISQSKLGRIGGSLITNEGNIQALMKMCKDWPLDSLNSRYASTVHDLSWTDISQAVINSQLTYSSVYIQIIYATKMLSERSMFNIFEQKQQLITF